MIRLFGRKVLRLSLAIWLVMTLTFLAMHLSGDPADNFLPPDASEAMRKAFVAKWGLDRPLLVQYAVYFGNLVQGDLGTSFVDGRPAAVVIADRLPKTLQLLGTSFVLMVLFGFGLGLFAARFQDEWPDRAVMGFAAFGYSLPNFVFGIGLILIFAMQLRLLPSAGSDSWQSLILPSITIATTGGAVIARYVRAGMIEALAQPYILSARARGVSEPAIYLRHALPNAAIPIVTVLGFLLGSLVAGAVVTETVFAWPGIGRLTVSAVAMRDLAVVQGIVLLIAITMVTANLLVDLLYRLLDPRIRSEEAE